MHEIIDYLIKMLTIFGSAFLAVWSLVNIYIRYKEEELLSNVFFTTLMGSILTLSLFSLYNVLFIL